MRVARLGLGPIAKRPQLTAAGGAVPSAGRARGRSGAASRWAAKAWT